MSKLIELPSAITAGTTVRYYRTFAGYVSGTITTAKLLLAGPGAAAHIDGAPQVDGSYLFDLSNTFTGNLKPGTWRWTERITDDTGAVADYASGTVDVAPDLAQATAGSTLTHEERIIPILEAALEGRYDDGMESFSIFGRTINRVPHDQIVKRLKEARNAVAMAKGLSPFGPPILAKFTGAASDSGSSLSQLAALKNKLEGGV